MYVVSWVDSWNSLWTKRQHPLVTIYSIYWWPSGKRSTNVNRSDNASSPISKCALWELYMWTLPYKERLAGTGLWTLEDRLVRAADLTEGYKIIRGFSSVSFHTLFEFSHNRNTRGHSLKLQKRRVRTDLRQHFFTERVTYQSLEFVGRRICFCTFCDQFQRNNAKDTHGWVISETVRVYMTARTEPDLWGYVKRFFAFSLYFGHVFFILVTFFTFFNDCYFPIVF